MRRTTCKAALKLIPNKISKLISSSGQHVRNSSNNSNSSGAGNDDGASNSSHSDAAAATQALLADMKAFVAVFAPVVAQMEICFPDPEPEKD